MIKKSMKPTRRERPDDTDEMKTLRRKRRSARAKGHRFENDMANIFKVVFPNARRLLENHKDDARGVDLLHTGSYRIQCKKYVHYVNPSVINEVQCDEFLGEVPVLITAGDNRRPLVVVPLDEFLRLIKLERSV